MWLGKKGGGVYSKSVMPENQKRGASLDILKIFQKRYVVST